MNLHGIIEPVSEAPARPTLVQSAWAWVRGHRNFCLFVLLPTLLTGIYFYLIASNQYESEAHFLVRRSGQENSPGTGVSQALSMATGISSAQSEQMSVADYLTSHDAVATLQKEDRLVERFHRTGADPFSRLWFAHPKPETLLKYYNKQVSVKYDTETGITTLLVRSFTPKDSYDLAEKLLQLGEKRVNYMNMRSYDDAVSISGRQLADAENAIAALQSRITHYRRSRADIDPKTSSTTQIQLVGTLTGQLTAAQAQLSAMGQTIDHSSPQYLALSRRVQALQSQINALSARLTQSGNSMADDLGGFEDLKLRQDFLAKRYDAAASSLERAKSDAMRQQLFVVRVVDANMPVKSTYPHKGRIILTTFIALLLAYCIGWLIAAGVREHAA